jgi:hypothetical protein
MVATPFTIVTTAAAGAVLAAANAVDNTNGNSWVNTGRELIEITNGSGSNLTTTFVTQGNYAVGAILYAVADLNVVVANATTKVCGPFDKGLFNDTNGLVQVSYSTGSSVTARVISLGTA